MVAKLTPASVLLGCSKVAGLPFFLAHCTHNFRTGCRSRNGREWLQVRPEGGGLVHQSSFRIQAYARQCKYCSGKRCASESPHSAVKQHLSVVYGQDCLLGGCLCFAASIFSVYVAVQHRNVACDTGSEQLASFLYRYDSMSRMVVSK